MFDDSDFQQNDLIARGVHDFGARAPVNAGMGEVEQKVCDARLTAMRCCQRTFEKFRCLGADAGQDAQSVDQLLDERTEHGLRTAS